MPLGSVTTTNENALVQPVPWALERIGRRAFESLRQRRVNHFQDNARSEGLAKTGGCSVIARADSSAHGNLFPVHPLAIK